MKLRDSLYYINNKVTEGTAVRYDVQLDASHFIYQAHFPGEPITPGVCIIQIAKELLEDCLLDKIAEDTEARTCRVQVTISAGGASLAKLSFTCHQK